MLRVGLPESSMNSMDRTLRKVVALVAVLNLAYFGVEFALALSIGSVSLFADSIDFLEDTAVNLLIVVALGWSLRRRARVGMGMAALLLVPSVSTLWMAWQKLSVPVAPDATLLSLTGTGALAVNLFCAYLLARYRHVGGSLTRAAWLSARNDALANVAIVLAGLVTAVTVSPWPDLVVGLGIFLINLDAAREIYEAARKERVAAS
ncbi:cation diffusion facilitator family transporter [Oleiagrimonas citrea]|nr:cation diffusion facilitator family transporter [Oleiagrimonas citrea]